MDNKEQRFSLVEKSKTFERIVNNFELNTKKVLDLGCGFGEHLSFFGKGSVGITTKNEEIGVGLKRGLVIKKGNVEFLEEIIETNNYFDIIWANNILEHLLSPHSFLMKLKKVSSERTILILGVPVIPILSFLAKFNRFRGSLADAHTGFYNKETLILTIEAAGWSIKEIRPFYFDNYFLDKIIAFISPFFYVIAEDKRDFVYSTKKCNEWISDDHYDYLFKITGQK